MNYLKGALGPVPQSESAKPGQVKNAAGGYVFALDKWSALHRFLIIGSEGGTYYVGERDLTKTNLDALRACLAEDGPRVVYELLVISQEGRAPKNDQAILALAMAAASTDVETKRAALDALPLVCRTSTHLYQFCGFVQQARGWGRALRRAVADWYVEKPADRLAYQAVKYRSRYGWSHRDVLRLAHPSGFTNEQNLVAKFMLGQTLTNAVGEIEAQEQTVITGYRRAQLSSSPAQTAHLIEDYNLPREAVKPEHLDDPAVWQALLESGMPLTAMIRNLGNMSKAGTLVPMSSAENLVLLSLGNEDVLRSSRVHPLAILTALKTYSQGHGFRGGNTWSPAPRVIDALDSAFYAAFGNVKPAGKRTMIALDISGSMHSPFAGSPLTCAEASMAMALVTAAVEPKYGIFGFNNALTPLNVSPRQRLDDVVRQSWSGGSTDAAKPMLYADAKAMEIDTFMVYTDNETWAGGVHPFQALKDYRKHTGIDARLSVVAFTATDFTIADPSDPGMLDVAGFDTATPEVLRAFSAGEL